MKSIKSKLLVGIIVPVGVILTLVAVIAAVAANVISHQNTVRAENNLRIGYDKEIKMVTQLALDIIEHNHKLFQEGKITEEQAKENSKAEIRSLRYGKDGYFWIDSYKGILIAHPIIPEKEGADRTGITDPKGTKLIQNIIGAKDSAEGIYTEYLWEKPEDKGTAKLSSKRAFSVPFAPWEWIISTGNYVDYIDREITDLRDGSLKRTTMGLVGVIGLMAIGFIAIAVVAIIISNKMSRAVNSIIGGFSKDENNRIRLSELEISTNDEIGALANTLNEFQFQIKNFITNSTTNAAEVANSTNRLQINSEETARAAEEIVIIIDQLAHSASNASEMTTSGTMQMADFENVLRQSSDQTAEVSEMASQVTNTVSEGMDALRELIEITNKNEIAIDEIGEIIKHTEESSNKINSASEVIRGIADQTNLLALNAAIEAARAGDAGRGFGVVAEEIRKLAEESSKSTEEINQVVQELTENASFAVEKMADIVSAVGLQQENVRQTETRFTKIETAINASNTEIEKVHQSTQRLVRDKESIDEILNQIQAISEDNAATTQQASASIQQQSSQISEITDEIVKLNGISDNLKTQIAQFEI